MFVTKIFEVFCQSKVAFFVIKKKQIVTDLNTNIVKETIKINNVFYGEIYEEDTV